MQQELHTKEGVGEKVILEQLLNILSPEVRTWVREHEPEDGMTAAGLAFLYLNAHKVAPNAPSRPAFSQRPARDYKQGGGNTGVGIGSDKFESKGKSALICFFCQQPGHKASFCPLRKAKLTGFCSVPRDGDD